uniref:Uncharacterized protein n=1 Tax=Aureoumbra lagunensis TaxID=44058 RepID=A0A7S3NKR0_9STRA
MKVSREEECFVAIAKAIQENDIDALDSSIRLADVVGIDTLSAQRARCGLKVKRALAEYARCVLMSSSEAASTEMSLSDALCEAQKYNDTEGNIKKLQNALDATRVLIAQAKDRKMVKSSALLAARYLDDASIIKLKELISHMAHTDSDESCLVAVQRMRACEVEINESIKKRNRQSLNQALENFDHSLNLFLNQALQDEWVPLLVDRCRASPDVANAKELLKRLENEHQVLTRLRAAITKHDYKCIEDSIDAVVHFSDNDHIRVELEAAQAILKDFKYANASNQKEEQLALLRDEISTQLDIYLSKSKDSIKKYERELEALLQKAASMNKDQSIRIEKYERELEALLAKADQVTNTLDRSVITVTDQLDFAQNRFRQLEQLLGHKLTLNNTVHPSQLSQEQSTMPRCRQTLWSAYLLAFIEFLVILSFPYIWMTLTCCATVARVFDTHSIKSKYFVFSLPEMRLDKTLVLSLFSLPALVWAADSTLVNTYVARFFCSSPLAGFVVAFQIDHSRSLHFLLIAIIATIVTWFFRYSIINRAAVLESGLVLWLIFQKNSFTRLHAALLKHGDGLLLFSLSTVFPSIKKTNSATLSQGSTLIKMPTKKKRGN